MEWGHSQNLISVIIGLNIAYFSFKEIRSPQLFRFLKLIEELITDAKQSLDDVNALNDWAHISNEESKLNANQSLLHTLTDIRLRAEMLKLQVSLEIEHGANVAWERFFSMCAMLIAVLATIFLVMSTIKFNTGISPILFSTITIFGFAPVVALIALNFTILYQVQKKFEFDLFRLGARAMAARLKIDSECLRKAREGLRSYRLGGDKVGIGK
jgi:hypothetical protein